MVKEYNNNFIIYICTVVYNRFDDMRHLPVSMSRYQLFHTQEVFLEDFLFGLDDLKSVENFGSSVGVLFTLMSSLTLGISISSYNPNASKTSVHLSSRCLGRN